MEWLVYILSCGDGTLYTGVTNDLPRRLSDHLSGKGAKYTRGRGPLTVVHTEAFADRGKAQAREAAVKRMTRAAKLKLMEEGGLGRS